MGDSMSETAPAAPGVEARAAAARTASLTKVYGQGETRVVALDAVTVAFPRGELTAIMGRRGRGSRP